MLPPINVLNQNLLNLSPTTDKPIGIKNFVKVIADFTNQVQAGPTGTPGILIFNNAAMEAILNTQSPVPDSSWISNFANAWQAGILEAVIVPGTVSNPAWTGSMVDISTLPSAASTITTIAAAKQALIGKLQLVDYNNAAMPMATAIDAATRALKFLCIGLGAPPVLPPIPLTFAAQ